MYKKLAILIIAVTLLLLGTGISIVLAKMPANYSTNPNVLKIELNQTGNQSGQFFILVYHDLKAGYWDIGFTGNQRSLKKGNITHSQTKGNVSFPDSQINQFTFPM